MELHRLLSELIIKNEPLKGKMLNLALKIIDESYIGFSDAQFLDTIKDKLTAGQPLNDYEQHIIVDVLLLHNKLALDRFTLQVVLLCDHAFEIDIPEEVANNIEFGSRFTLDNIKNIALFEESASEMLNTISTKAISKYFVVDNVNYLKDLNCLQFILIEP